MTHSQSTCRICFSFTLYFASIIQSSPFVESFFHTQIRTKMDDPYFVILPCN